MVSAIGTERRSEFQVPSEASCVRIRGVNPGVGTQVGMHVRSPMPGLHSWTYGIRAMVGFVPHSSWAEDRDKAWR